VILNAFLRKNDVFRPYISNTAPYFEIFDEMALFELQRVVAGNINQEKPKTKSVWITDILNL